MKTHHCDTLRQINVFHCCNVLSLTAFQVHTKATLTLPSQLDRGEKIKLKANGLR